MDATWYDNRPCDRADSRFKRLVYLIVLVIFLPGAVAVFFLFVLAGGSPSGGMILAVLLGGGGGLILGVLPTLAESNAPALVSFEREEIVWKTRSGRLHRAAYSDIDQIQESMWKGDWKDGDCQRYVVSVHRPLGFRLFFWLNRDNKGRLENALRGSRAASWQKR